MNRPTRQCNARCVVMQVSTKHAVRVVLPFALVAACGLIRSALRLQKQEEVRPRLHKKRQQKAGSSSCILVIQGDTHGVRPVVVCVLHHAVLGVRSQGSTTHPRHTVAESPLTPTFVLTGARVQSEFGLLIESPRTYRKHARCKLSQS
jgi:hypothetical protein